MLCRAAWFLTFLAGTAADANVPQPFLTKIREDMGAHGEGFDDDFDVDFDGVDEDVVRELEEEAASAQDQDSVQDQDAISNGDASSSISDSEDSSKVRGLQDIDKPERCRPTMTESCVSYYVSGPPKYKFRVYGYENKDVWPEMHPRRGSPKYYKFSGNVRISSNKRGTRWIITVKIPHADLEVTDSAREYAYLKLRVEQRPPNNGKSVLFHPAPSLSHGVSFTPFKEGNVWGNCDLHKIFNYQPYKWPKSVCLNANRGKFGLGDYNLRPHTRISYSKVFNRDSRAPDGWRCAIGKPVKKDIRSHHCKGAKTSLCSDVHKLTDHSTIACIHYKQCLASGQRGKRCMDDRRALQGLSAPRRLQLTFFLAWGALEAAEALVALVEAEVLLAPEEVELASAMEIGMDVFEEDTWAAHFENAGVQGEHGPAGFWARLKYISARPGVLRAGRTYADAIDVIGSRGQQNLVDMVTNGLAA